MEYKRALLDAARLGAIKALEEAGLLKPYMKLAEAKRKYGAYYVAQWIKKGLVKPIKEGGRNTTVRLKRIELEAAASTEILNNHENLSGRKN